MLPFQTVYAKQAVSIKHKVMGKMWHQNKLCVEHAGLHWEIWRQCSQKEHCGFGGNCRSQGTQHNVILSLPPALLATQSFFLQICLHRYSHLCPTVQRKGKRRESVLFALLQTTGILLSEENNKLAHGGAFQHIRCVSLQCIHGVHGDESWMKERRGYSWRSWRKPCWHLIFNNANTIPWKRAHAGLVREIKGWEARSFARERGDKRKKCSLCEMWKQACVINVYIWKAHATTSAYCPTCAWHWSWNIVFFFFLISFGHKGNL